MDFLILTLSNSLMCFENDANSLRRDAKFSLIKYGHNHTTEFLFVEDVFHDISFSVILHEMERTERYAKQ